MDEPSSGSARFDELLAGIAAEAEAADAAALDADIAEMERASRAESRLLGRLRAQREASLEIAGSLHVTGLIAAVGRDVVVIAGGDGDWAVPVWGISAVIGLGEGIREPALAHERLGLASVARAWARQRSVVRLVRIAGAPLDGTIDRVGSDFIDLAEHDPGEPRRPEAVRRDVTIPLGALAAIRRR